MIAREGFARVLGWLAALYPRYTLEAPTIQAYYDVLADLALDQLKAAAQHLGATSKWFPAAAELREAAFDLLERGNGVPTAGEAWAEALHRIDRYSPPTESDFSHPLVKRALDAIGGNNVLCDTTVDMLHTARARYLEAYQALVHRGQVETRMLPAVRELAAQLAANHSRQLGPGR